MKTFALGAALIGSLVLATVSVAGDVQAGNAGRGQLAATAATIGPTVATSVTQENWRYVRYEGRWWYWTPTSRWMYFENGRWASVEPTASRTGAIARTVAETTADPGPSQAATGAVLDRGNSCPLPTSQGYSCPAAASSPAMSFGTHGSAISFGF
jgi:hypothetical protein